MTEQDLVKLDLASSFAMYTGVYRSWQAEPFRVRLLGGQSGFQSWTSPALLNFLFFCCLFAVFMSQTGSNNLQELLLLAKFHPQAF